MKPLILAAAASAALVLSAAVLPAQQPGGVKAFTGARVWDGTDRAPVDNATIVVRDGRVVAVGPSDRVTVPSGAERIAIAGKHVIPGLINAHGHVGNTVGLEQGKYSAEQVAKDLRLYAAYGITTVVSLGDDQGPSFSSRDSQRSPALARSRIFVAGPVLTPTTPEEAREQVAKVALMKADWVKIRVDDNLGTTRKMEPQVYRAVIDEAHKRGMRVAVHVFYLADTKALLAAGVDFIAHSVRDADVDEAMMAALKKQNVCLCPTLMREVSTFVYESTPPFFSDPLFTAQVDPKVIETLKEPARQEAMRKSTSAQRYKAGLEVATRNLKKLSDAGVMIAMGTDTGPPARFQGYFELMELEMMTKAGLTPRQVLTAATRDAARCMRIQSEVGTLESGKWADFVVLNGDPLADVKATRNIDSVWIAGNRVAR
jgi:imidazolonepropionase-like amidohydrolase